MLFSSSLRSPAAAAGNCRLFHSSRRILGSDALIVGVHQTTKRIDTCMACIYINHLVVFIFTLIYISYLILKVSSSAGTANTSIVESLAASKIIPSHLHDRIQAQLDASHFDPSQQGQVRM